MAVVFFLLISSSLLLNGINMVLLLSIRTDCRYFIGFFYFFLCYYCHEICDFSNSLSNLFFFCVSARKMLYVTKSLCFFKFSSTNSSSEILSASTAKMMFTRKKPQRTTTNTQPITPTLGIDASMMLYMIFDQPSSVTMTKIVMKPKKILSKVPSPKKISGCISGWSVSRVRFQSPGVPQIIPLGHWYRPAGDLLQRRSTDLS